MVLCTCWALWSLSFCLSSVTVFATEECWQDAQSQPRGDQEEDTFSLIQSAKGSAIGADLGRVAASLAELGAATVAEYDSGSRGSDTSIGTDVAGNSRPSLQDSEDVASEHHDVLLLLAQRIRKTTRDAQESGAFGFGFWMIIFSWLVVGVIIVVLAHVFRDERVDIKPSSSPGRSKRAARKDDKVNVSNKLCPALVLPVCESRFAVSVDELSRADEKSTIDVTAFGVPLLTIDMTSINALEIGLTKQFTQPRCEVRKSKVGDADHFCVRDTQGEVFAMFEAKKPGEIDVFARDEHLMQVEYSLAHLEFSAKSKTGVPMAVASINDQDYPPNHLEICCLPGTDAVLMLVVVLALALFSSAGSLRSSPNEGEAPLKEKRAKMNAS